MAGSVSHVTLLSSVSALTSYNLLTSPQVGENVLKSMGNFLEIPQASLFCFRINFTIINYSKFLQTIRGI